MSGRKARRAHLYPCKERALALLLRALADSIENGRASANLSREP